MGDHDVGTGPDEKKLRAFTRAVLDDLTGLEKLLEAGSFETGIRRIGAEQEMFLVDGSRQPASVAVELLALLEHEPRLTTELARYNLEANLTPHEFGGSCLSTMEKEIHEVVGRVREAAAKLDANVALAGILPTLRKSHLRLDHMTPNPRYFELNRAITAARDGAFSIVIKGLDELDITHDNVMLEAANTSFQIHFQVGPEEFAPLYNVAQAISAPVLAAAVNSPLLLGHRLWNETRVALFQRSVDSRSATQRARAKPTRVSFGDKWIEKSILEIYKDDIARFRIMLSTDELDENALECIADGRIPSLRALRMHTGTVWRWNRACYGFSGDKPHLRIENRILPAGPSIVDEVANSAFFYGLMASVSREHERIDQEMDFDDAKGNFFAAARHGLQAQFTWVDGKTHTAHDLIIDRLLPSAREGLKAHGIDSGDIDRYLGVIEERVKTRQTGSAWVLRSLSKMGRAPKDVRLRSLTRCMVNNQQSGRPVHEWPLAELYRTRDWFPSYRTVGQFMSTDLYTVRPSDPIEMAARLMDWRQIRHVPVEDDHGRLVGLLSFRDILRLVTGENRGATGERMVEDIMRKEPETVYDDTPTLEALTLMREQNIGSLPVVDREGKLLGLITVYDLLEIAGKVLEDFLRGDDTHRRRPTQREMAVITPDEAPPASSVTDEATETVDEAEPAQ